MPEIPRPSWVDFAAKFARRWKQGEHVFIAGQTGSGKTELELNILNVKPNWHKLVLVTKPDDPIFRTELGKEYDRLQTFNKKSVNSLHHDVMLAPKAGKSTAQLEEQQKEVFAEAIDFVYLTKGWTLGIDELAYMNEQLGLFKPLAMLHHMGRAYGITCVSATQRPSRIPLIVPQSATHAFIAKTNLEADFKRLSDLGGFNSQLKSAIQSLEGKHDFVYVDTDGMLPLAIVNTQR